MCSYQHRKDTHDKNACLGHFIIREGFIGIRMGSGLLSVFSRLPPSVPIPTGLGSNTRQTHNNGRLLVVLNQGLNAPKVKQCSHKGFG